MEFLVEFEIEVPAGTPETEVRIARGRRRLPRRSWWMKAISCGVWKRPLSSGETSVLGLYRAESEAELDGLLSALPLYEWMTVTVTGLEPHPNDPAAARRGAS